MDNNEIITKNITSTKRLDYVDTAKFIGIFLVAFTHIIEKGSSIDFIYSFHLPLFFFLSGLTLRVRDDDNFYTFLARKIKSYIVPLFCMDLLNIFINMGFLIGEGNSDVISWQWFFGFFDQFALQKRFYSQWFLAALLVSVLLSYMWIKIGKNKLWLVFILSFAQLGIAMWFNSDIRMFLPWNMDAAFFGCFFVLMGWCFAHLGKVNEFLVKDRIISLVSGLALLGGGLGLAYVIKTQFNTHLEMYSQTYKPYYVTIPSAILSSIGILLISCSITNKVMAEIGKTTLVILAIQQELIMRLWKKYIFHDFYASLASLPDDSLQRVGYAFSGAVASCLVGFLLFYLIRYSLFSFGVNKPLPEFYKKGYTAVSNKMKAGITSMKNKHNKKDEEIES